MAADAAETPARVHRPITAVDAPRVDVAEHTAALRRWLERNAPALKDYRERSPLGIDAEIDHDRGLMRLLYDEGWGRWGWPVEAGGLGGPSALRAVLYDELAWAGVDVP